MYEGLTQYHKYVAIETTLTDFHNNNAQFQEDWFNNILVTLNMKEDLTE